LPTSVGDVRNTTDRVTATTGVPIDVKMSVAG
jgi:hypothetical protein